MIRRIRRVLQQESVVENKSLAAETSNAASSAITDDRAMLFRHLKCRQLLTLLYRKFCTLCNNAQETAFEKARNK